MLTHEFKSSIYADRRKRGKMKQSNFYQAKLIESVLIKLFFIFKPFPDVRSFNLFGLP